jgi:hypothetical protein
LTQANLAVIGVFRRYIQIGDPQILIPTALEFIHCVVHYLQSTEGFEQCESLKERRQLVCIVKGIVLGFSRNNTFNIFIDNQKKHLIKITHLFFPFIQQNDTLQNLSTSGP